MKTMFMIFAFFISAQALAQDNGADAILFSHQVLDGSQVDINSTLDMSARRFGKQFPFCTAWRCKKGTVTWELP